MIAELNLWAAQDALLTALGAKEALDRGGAAEVALDIGFPVNVRPEHVWIAGEADGALESELTARGPSRETFRLDVFVFVAAAEEYAVLRDRLKTLATAVEGALASDGFAAVVPSWSVTQYRLEEGTDGTNRQLCLELTVECRCW